MEATELVAIARLKQRLGGNRYKVTSKGDGLKSLCLPADVWLYRPLQHKDDVKQILKIATLGPQIIEGSLQPVKLIKVCLQSSIYSRVELSFSQHTKVEAPQKTAPIEKLSSQRNSFSIDNKLDTKNAEKNLRRTQQNVFAIDNRLSLSNAVALESPTCFAGGEKGLWLCAQKTQLNIEEDAPFLFQVLGLTIVSAGKKVAKVVDYFETGAHGILVVSSLQDGREIMIPFVAEHVRIDKDLNWIEVPNFHYFTDLA